jgi:hypothetical protein
LAAGQTSTDYPNIAVARSEEDASTATESYKRSAVPCIDYDHTTGHYRGNTIISAHLTHTHK